MTPSRPGPAPASMWARALSSVGPHAQQRVWTELHHADRVQLLSCAPALHPSVIADVLTTGRRPELFALARRPDLDADTALALAGRPSDTDRDSVREALAANPAAASAFDDEFDPYARAARPIPLAERLSLAELRPIPAVVFATLAHDYADEVRRALLTNPTLTADDVAEVMGHVARHSPSAALCELAMTHPSADVPLRARLLSGFAMPGGNVPAEVIDRLLTEDPLTWVPPLLHDGVPRLARQVVPYLSLLTPAGQARLLWALTRTDATADQYLRHLYAAHLDPAVRSIIGGWINAPGCQPATPETADRRIRHLLEDLGSPLPVDDPDDPDDGEETGCEDAAAAGRAPSPPRLVPLVAAPASVTVSTATLVAEIRGSVWGRHPLHLAAADQLPWAEVLAELAALRRIPPTVLKVLAARSTAPAELGHLLLSTAPDLLIGASHVRLEHVHAALSKPALTQSATLLAMLTWALPAFDVAVDDLATHVTPVAELFQLLDHLAACGGAAAAWAARTGEDIATRVAVVVADDPGRVRLLEAVGGLHHPGSLRDLLDLTEALAADPTPATERPPTRNAAASGDARPGVDATSTPDQPNASRTIDPSL